MIEESDDDESEDELYENAAEMFGESHAKGVSTAMNHYDRFLASLNAHKPEKYQWISLKVSPPEAFLHYRDTFGQFGTYLMKEVKDLKWGSTRGYLSKMKTEIEKMNPDTDIAKNDYYKKLLRTVKSLYTAMSKESGEAMRNSAPGMTSDDMRILCQLMFDMNTPTMLNNRELILADFHAICRISASAAMKCSKLGLKKTATINTLNARLLETKTGTEKDLLIFMHATDWIICPVHGLGT